MHLLFRFRVILRQDGSALLLTLAESGFFEFDRWSDSMVYFAMATVGTVLFAIKLGLLLIVGVDGDVDFDVADGGGLDVHAGGFHLFSLLSIVSFMMGAGWMGFTCRQEWGLGSFAAAAIASGFGFGLMMLSSAGMYQMQKLNEMGSYEVRNTIGKIGRVYLKIPAKGQGRGQVQIAVDGRHKVIAAVSTGPEIASFAAVKVVDVRDDDALVVEPA
jgi:hypothetical protein